MIIVYLSYVAYYLGIRCFKAIIELSQASQTVEMICFGVWFCQTLTTDHVKVMKTIEIYSYIFVLNSVTIMPLFKYFVFNASCLLYLKREISSHLE